MAHFECQATLTWGAPDLRLGVGALGGQFRDFYSALLNIHGKHRESTAPSGTVRSERVPLVASSATVAFMMVNCLPVSIGRLPTKGRLKCGPGGAKIDSWINDQENNQRSRCTGGWITRL